MLVNFTAEKGFLSQWLEQDQVTGFSSFGSKQYMEVFPTQLVLGGACDSDTGSVNDDEALQEFMSQVAVQALSESISSGQNDSWDPVPYTEANNGMSQLHEFPSQLDNFYLEFHGISHETCNLSQQAPTILPISTTSFSMPSAWKALSAAPPLITEVTVLEMLKGTTSGIETITIHDPLIAALAKCGKKAIVAKAKAAVGKGPTHTTHSCKVLDA